MKTVVVYSGGMDSTVLLGHLIDGGEHEVVEALTINYGQRHRREILAAAECASFLGAPHRVVDLSNLAGLLPGSALTNPDVPVPHGHYEAESMKVMVVPNRNMILLAVATGRAVALGAEAVAYAAHAGDHTIYPDCRPEFAIGMSYALAACSEDPGIELLRPFVSWTKAGIVQRAQSLGMVGVLARTWSCYEGAGLHCGKCGTCVERKEAFHLAGVPDPTEYAS